MKKWFKKVLREWFCFRSTLLKHFFGLKRILREWRFEFKQSCIPLHDFHILWYNLKLLIKFLFFWYSFWLKTIVKKRYYENESLALAWDCVKGAQKVFILVILLLVKKLVKKKVLREWFCFRSTLLKHFFGLKGILRKWRFEFKQSCILLHDFHILWYNLKLLIKLLFFWYSFWLNKIVKKRYYGNESLGLAWDCVKGAQKIFILVILFLVKQMVKKKVLPEWFCFRSTLLKRFFWVKKNITGMKIWV